MPSAPPNPLVAVVTGASRGAGRGIAQALGQHGATVYATGRSTSSTDSPYGGTVGDTASLVDEAGGRGIAVNVDHADDAAVADLFAAVRDELMVLSGRALIGAELGAYFGVTDIAGTMPRSLRYQLGGPPEPHPSLR